MAVIQTRRLDSNGDPIRGNGLQNFVTDIDAISQIILTTIRLLSNEWFEALNLGTPLFQKLLGVPTTNEGVALIMTQRILSVPFVTGVSNAVVLYFAGRAFTFSANVQTVFGTITITTQQPGN